LDISVLLHMTIIDHIIGLVEARIELAKLSVKDEVSSLASKLIVAVIMSIFAFFIWFYLSLALGYYLNAITDSRYWGILIIAGIHIVILAIIYFFHKQLRLKQLIESGLDTILYSDDDDEKDEGRA
jgi:uncharacterized membrane protein YqjE